VNPGEASPAFIDAVHDALLHLYDPKGLEDSDLRRWLGLGERAGASELHRIILNAVDELKPSLEARREAKAWRPYRALYHRHVEQFTQREVSVALALSVRQLRREEQQALTRLANILWERYDAAKRLPSFQEEERGGVSSRQQPSSHEDELRWLERSSQAEVLDLAEMVGSILSVTEPLASNLGVSVRWEAPQTTPYVSAQAASLRQALINLLSCTMRAAPGGWVEVALASCDDSHTLSLRPRLPAGRQARPLSGEDDHLRMARQLLELSGATLTVVASGEAACPGAISLTIGAVDRATILVIDDNADTLRLVERYLAGSRFAFAGTRDPEEALVMAARLAPAAIVLDVMLPGIDGWELLGRLRTHPKTAGVPVIVCTILPEEQLALSLGAAEFLRKPINHRTLLAALQRQVGSASPAGG